MKRWIYIAVGIAALSVFAVSATPAFTADNGTVNMTIQVASPCITVSPQSVEFTPKTFSASATEPTTSDASAMPEVTNCAAASESLFMQASNAAGSLGAQWSLTSPSGIGVNQYALKVGQQAATPGLAAFGSLAAGDTRKNPLVLYMPTAGSAGSGQTMSMSVTFTATF